MSGTSRPGHPARSGLASLPLHPILAAVTLSAWSATVVADLASIGADQAWTYVRAAFVSAGLSVVVGVGTALVGLLDLRSVPRTSAIWQKGIRHLLAMDVALILFTLSWLLRRDADFAVGERTATLPMLLAMAGLVVAAGGAWIGHRLVYSSGVGVASEGERLQAFTTAEDGSQPAA